MRLLLAVAWCLAFVRPARAQVVDYIDGFALFFGTPTTNPNIGRYHQIPPNPKLTAAWFEREMKAVSDRAKAYDFTNAAMTTLAEAAYGMIGAKIVPRLDGKHLGRAVEHLVDRLATERRDVIESDRIALLKLFTASQALTATTSAADIERVALSKAVIETLPGPQRAAYRELVKELVKNWSHGDIIALDGKVRIAGADVAAVEQQIAGQGGATKAIAGSHGVVRSEAEFQKLQKQLLGLREAQKAFQQAGTDRARATAMEQIVDRSRQLADVAQIIHGAFRLARHTKGAAVASKVVVGLTTVTNVASSLPHNPLGAAVHLLGGLGGIFGSGQDVWKEEVSSQLYAIRQELFEQHRMLTELLQAVQVLAASELVTQEMLVTLARIQDRWFHRVVLDLGELDARLAQHDLAPFRACRGWATTSAAASVSTSIIDCGSALEQLQTVRQGAGGKFEMWAQPFVANASFTSGQPAGPAPNSVFRHAVDLLGLRAVYREMAEGCARSQACTNAVAQSLPDKVRNAYAGAAFLGAPLLDPRYVQVLAEGTNAWFDFYSVCQDPRRTAPALASFTGKPPYNVQAFPPDLATRCKRVAWRHGIQPQLHTAMELVRISRVQLAILSGEYLSDDAVQELASAPARGVFARLEQPPTVGCSAFNPSAELAKLVQACTDKPRCELLQKYQAGVNLGAQEVSKLQNILELESGRLCSSAAGTRIACLMDLNRLFAENVGLRWARRWVRGSTGIGQIRRLHAYGLGYYDPGSCAGLHGFMTPKGVLEGLRRDAHQAIGKWSTTIVGTSLHVSHNGQLACVLAQNSNPGVQASWSARVFEVSGSRCNMTTMPLPSPQALRLGIPMFTTKVADELSGLEAQLLQRALLVDHAPDGSEVFNAERWKIYGRMRRIHEASANAFKP